MSERYRPSKLKRDRAEQLPKFKPEPRAQTVWRDGKPVVQEPLLCRPHNQPWQTCELCSKVKK